MLSAIESPHAFRIRTLAIIGAMVAIVVASQVLTQTNAAPVAGPAAADERLQPVLADLDAGAISVAPADGADTGVAAAQTADAYLDRIRADVAFWGKRAAADPDDFVSSNRYGTAQIELARATGDLSAFLGADAAFDLTLKRDPHNAAALAYKGSVLVSLHRFTDAAAHARAELALRPAEPVALATLGDAELELGDLVAARDAFHRVDALNPSAATEGRLSHLAFITGDTATAVAGARQALKASKTEGAEGERAAFYHYQLADVLISTGDRPAAAKEYAAALKADPHSFLAHSGLARVAAADGDFDEAIAQISAAIDIVPQPEFLARRADLYTLRAKPGDSKLAAADAATVEAIAKLAGEAASVYDRQLALYLANHGLDPERAVDLAAKELAVRKDVYGYDASAWTLLAAGRPTEADAAMAKALAVGTIDAKVLYHAGMIDAALGRTAQARAHLERGPAPRREL